MLESEVTTKIAAIVAERVVTYKRNDRNWLAVRQRSRHGARRAPCECTITSAAAACATTADWHTRTPTKMRPGVLIISISSWRNGSCSPLDNRLFANCLSCGCRVETVPWLPLACALCGLWDHELLSLPLILRNGSR
jgi:hypothetical protein